ncbi:hypothetical protein GCM10027190_19550 [Spirosoma areae]
MHSFQEFFVTQVVIVAVGPDKPPEPVMQVIGYRRPVQVTQIGSQQGLVIVLPGFPLPV